MLHACVLKDSRFTNAFCKSRICAVRMELQVILMTWPIFSPATTTEHLLQTSDRIFGEPSRRAPTLSWWMGVSNGSFTFFLDRGLSIRCSHPCHCLPQILPPMPDPSRLLRPLSRTVSLNAMAVFAETTAAVAHAASVTKAMNAMARTVVATSRTASPSAPNVNVARTAAEASAVPAPTICFAWEFPLPRKKKTKRRQLRRARLLPSVITSIRPATVAQTANYVVRIACATTRPRIYRILWWSSLICSKRCICMMSTSQRRAVLWLKIASTRQDSVGSSASLPLS
jgi:hypothetical protein